PLRSHHRVMPEMPPEVIRQMLRTAFLLPLPLERKRLRIHQKNSSRPVAAGRAKRAAIDSIRPAMNRMRRGVAGLLDEFLRFDHLHNRWLSRILLGVEDMQAR